MRQYRAPYRASRRRDVFMNYTEAMRTACGGTDTVTWRRGGLAATPRKEANATYIDKRSLERDSVSVRTGRGGAGQVCSERETDAYREPRGAEARPSPHARRATLRSAQGLRQALGPRSWPDRDTWASTPGRASALHLAVSTVGVACTVGHPPHSCTRRASLTLHCLTGGDALGPAALLGDALLRAPAPALPFRRQWAVAAGCRRAAASLERCEAASPAASPAGPGQR